MAVISRLLAVIVAVQACTAYSAQASPGQPSVTSVTPNHGSVAGGQTVIIRGSAFAGYSGGCQGSYEISFGTDLEHGYAIAPTSYQVLSDSEISAVVPPSFGGTVNVRIGNSCGVSSSQPADEFTYDYPNSQCLQGSCTITVGASPQGALTHAALGFLNGFNTDAKVAITSRDTALVNALHPRQWRLGQSGIDEPSGGVLGLARSAGAQVSLDLTSDWQNWAYSQASGGEERRRRLTVVSAASARAPVRPAQALAGAGSTASGQGSWSGHSARSRPGRSR